MKKKFIAKLCIIAKSGNNLLSLNWLMDKVGCINIIVQANFVKIIYKINLNNQNLPPCSCIHQTYSVQLTKMKDFILGRLNPTFYLKYTYLFFVRYSLVDTSISKRSSIFKTVFYSVNLFDTKIKENVHTDYCK